MSLVTTSAPLAPISLPAATSLRRLSFHALGTPCEIQYAAPQGEAQAQRFERAAVGWVSAFEAKYSRFRPDSLVSRINAAAGKDWVAIDGEMEVLLKLCDSLFALSYGVLDPTVLPLLRLWNYKADVPRIPTAPEIEAARALVGWTGVKREPGRILLPKPGMALDFGGFGKEYAVDSVAQIAQEHGVSAALVDFGHDIRCVGTPPGRTGWHIGLEDPRAPGRAAGSIGLSNQSVASSGDYLRSFRVGGKRYGHIVDPRTGCPVDNGCLQATVIARGCLQAGLLSTTAFVLGPTAGIELMQSFPGVEGLIVTEQLRAQTRGFFNYVAT